MTDTAAPLHVTEPPTAAQVFPYRVFGIGMNKTGTSSLRQAFLALGVVPVTAERLVQRASIVEALFARGDYEPALRYARLYRGFEDRPWNVWEMYRRLDERYEGSRFVLTVRDPESWWRSVEQWITTSKPWVGRRYREHLRAASLRRQDMVRAYQAYNDEVRAYFGGRGDLLEIDLVGGQGWGELCRFLDLPVPGEEFPHANRQRYDERDRKVKKKPGMKSAAGVDVGTSTAPVLGFCAACSKPIEGKRVLLQERNWRSRLPNWLKRAYRAAQRRAFIRAASPAADARRVAELRGRHPGLRVDDLAVATCIFNPCGFSSRMRNYERFRAGLAAAGVPLLTVELAFGADPFALPAGDPYTIQLRTADVMWQKERLLNIGIDELLRRGYRKIVWLDADVLFDNAQHWPWHVAAALETHALCQVFGQVGVEQDGGRSVIPGVSAVRYLELTGQLLEQNRRGPSRRLPFGLPIGHSGYGWAARAEVLERVQLFDEAVIGGADKLMFAAACGRGSNWDGRLRHLFRSTLPPCRSCGHRNRSPEYAGAFARWADRWHEAVGGRVGWVDLTIRSLYHGDRRNRLYEARRDVLLRHRFDPGADLARDASGCWRWASDKPALHLEVQNYLFERLEDA